MIVCQFLCYHQLGNNLKKKSPHNVSRHEQHTFLTTVFALYIVNMAHARSNLATPRVIKEVRYSITVFPFE